MNGNELLEGQYSNRSLTNNDILMLIIKPLLSSSRHSSTYKFAFLKSLLDTLYLVDDNLKISFSMIFHRFTELYWSLVLKYRLKQNASLKHKTYLEQIFNAASKKWFVNRYIPFDYLSKEAQKEIVNEIEAKCKTYVVGALFGDTEQTIYSFSKKNEWIQFNPIVYTFLCANKKLIEKIDCYQWAKILEEFNANNPVVDLAADLLGYVGVGYGNERFALYRQILEFVFFDKAIYMSNKTNIDINAAAYEKTVNACEHVLNSNNPQTIESFAFLFEKEEKLRTEPKIIKKVDDVLEELSFKDEEKYIQMLDDPEKLIKALRKEKIK